MFTFLKIMFAAKSEHLEIKNIIRSRITVEFLNPRVNIYRNLELFARDIENYVFR